MSNLKVLPIKLKLLFSSPDLNMIRGQKFGNMHLHPHDPHEILNVSHVTESNLSADDFNKNGIENVEEVFEFKRYDADGNETPSKSVSYNIRFKDYHSCKSFFKKLKT